MTAGAWAIGGDEKRLGWGAIVAGLVGGAGAVAATQSGTGNLEDVVAWSALIAATLRYATPLIFGALGGHHLRAQRRGERRPRGHDAHGRVLRDLRRRPARLVVPRPAGRHGGRRRAGPRSRLLLDSAARRPDRQRHRAELPGPRSHGLRLPRPLRRSGHARQHPARARHQHPRRQEPLVLRRRDRPREHADVGRADPRRGAHRVPLPHAARPAPALGRRAPARGRDGRHLGPAHALLRRRRVGRCSPPWAAPTSRSASSAPSTRA